MFKAFDTMTRLAAAGTLVLAGLSIAPAAFAAGVDLSADSKVGMEGDSTLHRYHLYSKDFTFKAKLTGTTPAGMKLGSLNLVIPVKTLKSGDGALDGNAYRTMELDKFSTIEFNSTDCTLKVTGDDVDATAEGTLTIHGVSKPVTIKASGTLNGKKFTLKGSKDMLMSDFKVEAPVLLMGAIKCTDKITVKFDLKGDITD